MTLLVKTARERVESYFAVDDLTLYGSGSGPNGLTEWTLILDVAHAPKESGPRLHIEAGPCHDVEAAYGLVIARLEAAGVFVP